MSVKLSERILKLAKLDEEIRADLIRRGELFGGYHPEMEEVHNSNADSLAAILNESGWPSRQEIGHEASQAAWMIVQHAIGKPAFQKRCLELLRAEAKLGQFDPALIATLEDRIAVFEGRPQVYGTQFDWDDEGMLSPHPILNPAEVDKLRESIGLSPLDEVTQEIRQRAKKEGNRAPNDLKERQEIFYAWAKKVGWR